MICHVGRRLPREGAQEHGVMLSDPEKAALGIGLAPTPGKLPSGPGMSGLHALRYWDWPAVWSMRWPAAFTGA